MVYLGGTASCSFYLVLIADMLAVGLKWSSKFLDLFLDVSGEIQKVKSPGCHADSRGLANVGGGREMLAKNDWHLRCIR